MPKEPIWTTKDGTNIYFMSEFGDRHLTNIVPFLTRAIDRHKAILYADDMDFTWEELPPAEEIIAIGDTILDLEQLRKNCKKEIKRRGIECHT